MKNSSSLNLEALLILFHGVSNRQLQTHKCLQTVVQILSTSPACATITCARTMTRIRRSYQLCCKHEPHVSFVQLFELIRVLTNCLRDSTLRQVLGIAARIQRSGDGDEAETSRGQRV